MSQRLFWQVNWCFKSTSLLGETSFRDQKVVEKIMVSVPEKFEAKIMAIEEPCDLKNLTMT